MIQLTNSAHTASSADFPLQGYGGSSLKSLVIRASKGQPFYIADIYLDPAGANLATPFIDLMQSNDAGTGYKYKICFEPLAGDQNDSRYQSAFLLQEYLQKAAGGNWEVQKQVNLVNQRPANNIFVGNSTWLNKYFSDIDLSQYRPEQFLMCVKEGNLILAGLDVWGNPWDFDSSLEWRYTITPTPTIHAVSRFLEEFVGARWFWPPWTAADAEALGTSHVDKFGEDYLDLAGKKLEVPDSLYVMDEPSFQLRNIRLPCWATEFELMDFDDAFASKLQRRYCRWLRLNRLGAFDQIWVKHYWSQLLPKANYFDEHPEYYAFYNGARGGGESKETWGAMVDNQICVTSVDEKDKAGMSVAVRDEILNNISLLAFPYDENNDDNLKTKHSIPIASNDGIGGHCQCEPCKELDKVKPAGDGKLTYDVNYLADSQYANKSDPEKYAAGYINIGTRYFKFFRDLAQLVETEMPESKGKSQTVDANNAPTFWLTTLAYESHVLPYELKNDNVDRTYLPHNLIVFDTHNTYGLRHYDRYPTNTPEANARREQQYRMECWGRKGGDPQSPGRKTSGLAVWADINYINNTHIPFMDAMPVATNADPDVRTEPFVEMIARMFFNKYMGGYLNFGLAHWADIYLVARLLWDARPLDNELPSSSLDQYIKQLSEKASEIRYEYYTGLFGQAHQQVQAFHQLISDQLYSYISQATAAGKTYYQLHQSWSVKTLHEVLAAIRTDADELLTDAESVAPANSRSKAHVDVIAANWAITKSTIDLCQSLDVLDAAHVWLFLFVYTAEQLSAMRTFVGARHSRSIFPDEVNDPSWGADRCTLVVRPGDIPNQDATLEVAKYDLRAIKTILAVQNDTGFGYPVGAAYDPVTGKPREGSVRHQPSDEFITWTAVAEGERTRIDVWIDWFGRVDYDGKYKIYVVALNETGRLARVRMKIKNMDANWTERTLRYKTAAVRIPFLKGSGTTEKFDPKTDTAFPFPFDPANPGFSESIGVTDTAVFIVPSGSPTVLVLENANFIPSLTELTAYRSGTPVTEIMWTQLKETSFKMEPTDDTLFANGEAARFYVAKDGDPNFQKVSNGIVFPHNQPNMPYKTLYFESIYSLTLDVMYAGKNSADVIFVGDKKTTVKYYIWGAVYDKDGMKRVAVDAEGNLARIELTIKP